MHDTKPFFIDVGKEAEELLQYLTDYEAASKKAREERKYDAFDEKPKIAKHKLARAKAKKQKRKNGGKR